VQSPPEEATPARRRRKQRPSEAQHPATQEGPPALQPIPATQRGERPPRGQREELARAALTPLAPGERPRSLLVACVVSVLLAVLVVIGAATVHNLSSRGGSLPGAALIACVLVALAVGMARVRYWAVLSFEALLAFQIIVTSLALVVASTLTAAAICVVGIGLGGWLFWKLIRVMGRIQAADRQAPPDAE
jgi:hypothetical protein